MKVTNMHTSSHIIIIIIIIINLCFMYFNNFPNLYAAYWLFLYFWIKILKINVGGVQSFLMEVYIKRILKSQFLSTT